MTFEEYEKAAASTAIYPNRGSEIGLGYVALKMNGEAGEFAEHVGKAMRDDRFGEKLSTGHTMGLTSERRELLIKEVGDVLWYLAAAAHDLGTDLSTIAQTNVDKLKDRQNRNVLKGNGDTR